MKKLPLIFLCLLTWCKLHAQTPISIQETNVPLQQVLQHLQTHFNVVFSYSSDVVNVKKKVSLKLQNSTLTQALTALFDGTPVAFSIQDKLVVLYKSQHYQVTLSGYVREQETGELLIGASVSTIPLVAGAVNNSYGFYSITLPADTYQLVFQYVGYQPLVKKIIAQATTPINIELAPKTNLQEALIKGERDKLMITLNKVDIPLQEIKDVPMILGEKDVVKYMMLSPGVQKGNEGNGYIYVRGGGPDQNLIMIDDAVIYNAYHFLGLSSLFSGNELRKAELYKGGFSSRYGGRLSSVLDMSMKDGNREHFGVDGTVGVMSSRVLVEGPIQKNKSSFLFSARKSYIDKASTWVANNADAVLNYGYYDIHAKLSTDIGKRDRLMLSGYVGKDGLANNAKAGLTANEDGIVWGNQAASLRWNHLYSGKMFANTSLVYSYYKARIAFGDYDATSGRRTTSSIQSSITDYTLKHDIDYHHNTKHHFRTGAGYTQHWFNPITALKMNMPDVEYQFAKLYSTNDAFGYGEWNYKPTPKWTIVSGVRYSYYKYNKAYHRVEPRLNATYQTNTNWQINTSYSLMNQYLHLVSTFNGIGLPSDVWISSDEVLKPQRSNLITLGAAKNNLLNKGLSFSVEGYGKLVQHAVSLKEGASFFELLQQTSTTKNVNNLSMLATQGKSTSYGIEFMVRKSSKKFDGHISYTLSRTTMQFDSINNGKSYVATFDRPHDIGVYLSYRPNNRFKVSANWVYGTGNAITMPAGEYFVSVNDPTGGNGSWNTFYYDKKNNYRMQSYHRFDISFQYTHRIASKILSTIELSIYNVYNRANPFFYQINLEDENAGTGKRVLQKTSMFPIMPSLSWSIKI